MAAITVASAGTPPIIDIQPQSQTIASGDSLSYQRYQGASGDTINPIGDATSPSYTTPALTTDTSYWVLVSNPFGNADSQIATITVSPVTPTPSWPSSESSAGAVMLTRRI